MNNSDLEFKLKKVISDNTPDVFPKIKNTIANREEKVMKSNKLSFIKYAVAACFALCITVGGYGTYAYNYKTDSIIDIDVNPSIELLVNKKEKVIKAIPLNDDAKDILDDMELKKLDVNTATNAILGAIIKNGYISGDDAGVLVTVINDDDAKAKKIKDDVSNSVKKALDENNASANIVNQTVKADKELKNLAKDNNISIGKAALVQNISNQNDDIEIKDVSNKKVKELLNIVLEDSNAQSTEELEVELDDGIYEIEFIDKNKKYEYEINPVTGEVISKEVEIIHKKDKSDKLNDLDDDDLTSGDIDYDDNDIDDDDIDIDDDDDDDIIETSPTKKISIGKEKAVAIALTDAKLKNVEKMKISEDDDDFEIEFVGKNGKEYSYEINKFTGEIEEKEITEKEIKKIDIDDDDYDDDVDDDDDDDND